MRRTVALAILILGGCADSGAPGGAGDPPSQTSGYFPPALFQQRVDCGWSLRRKAKYAITEFEDAWYSKHLRAAGERLLSFASGSPEALRFTWLRTFHAPVIIRVEWASPSRAALTATTLSGAGGYEPGGVADTVRRPLTPEEIQRLVALREAALREPPAECTMMLDGAEWIVEAAGADGYHYVNAQSPETGAVRDLGLALLGFTGWTVDSIY